MILDTPATSVGAGVHRVDMWRWVLGFRVWGLGCRHVEVVTSLLYPLYAPHTQGCTDNLTFRSKP